MQIIMCNIYIMTKKYRSKKSTTKKYKQKRGGRDSEYGRDSESVVTSRGPVDKEDQDIANDVSKKIAEDKCDEAIKNYTTYFSEGDISSVGSLSAKINMKDACKSKCDNTQNCPSLNPENDNFFINLHSKSGDAIYDPVADAYVGSQKTFFR